jgi:uncharacterized membrane protein
VRAGTLIFKIIHWLLAILAVVLIFSGAGITEYRTVNALTFGLLGKLLYFKIHIYIWIPFTVLLFVHILYSTYLKKVLDRRDKNRTRKETKQ